MIFNCAIEHNARKDNHNADVRSRMYKYPGISTTKDDLIPHSVDYTTIKPWQEIVGSYINLADYSTSSSPTLEQPYQNVLSCRDMNFMHIDCDFNKCRSRDKTI